MSRRFLPPLLLILAGMAVMVYSIAWPRLAPPSGSWSEEQAESYAEASRAYHAAASQTPSGANRVELEHAKERYQHLRQQLDDARGGRVWVAMVLQMLGVGLGLVGAVWLIVLQNQAEDRRAASG